MLLAVKLTLKMNKNKLTLAEFFTHLQSLQMTGFCTPTYKVKRKCREKLLVQ